MPKAKTASTSQTTSPSTAKAPNHDAASSAAIPYPIASMPAGLFDMDNDECLPDPPKLSVEAFHSSPYFADRLMASTADKVGAAEMLFQYEQWRTLTVAEYKSRVQRCFDRQGQRCDEAESAFLKQRRLLRSCGMASECIKKYRFQLDAAIERQAKAQRALDAYRDQCSADPGHERLT
ncbi:hypothetical protein EMMF5_004712 [Cystobasidiomycetes sp. EMM_F5]